MKSLDRLTISMLTFGMLIFAAWTLAWGQGGNPPASTKESGKTSGRGYTPVEQTTRGSEAATAQELTALENKWTEAAKSGNAGELAPLLADSFVSTDVDGTVRNKAQTLERVKTGTWETNQISDVKVAVYKSAAVVTGAWTGKGTSDGKPVDSQERWTDTWVAMNGKWRCVASHSSPMK